MKIEHIAIWTEDLEVMRDFYVKYFGLSCNNRYHNPNKNFSSYFLSFGEGGTRIELMVMPGKEELENRYDFKGLAHFAISLGSKESVWELTERLRAEGYTVLSEPRTTGDGYFESAIADPEGNYVELTE